MRVIRRYIDTGEWSRIKYPRTDISEPIVNKDPNIDIYLEEDNIPAYDSETQYVKRSTIDFTDTVHSEYSHIKIAIQNYTVEDIPTTETIIL